MVGKPTPAASTKILQRPEGWGGPFNQRFNYRKVVGKLNFLEKSSRPDIAYASRQCARFSNNSFHVHADALVHLARYLRDTKDKGIIICPDKEKCLDIHADTDFSGNWSRENTDEDSLTTKSITRVLITFANCPVLYMTKLQTLIVLSTTEVEYVVLSQFLRETIPIIELLKELNKL